MSGFLLGMVLSVLADSTVWLSYPLELFPLSLVHVRTRLSFPLALPFPYICCIVFVHSLYHAVLCIVPLLVLGMLLLYGLLSHRIVDRVYILLSVSAFSIFLP